MSSRLLAGLFAALVSIALAGLSPAQAVGGVGDPSATRVDGACYGGSGRISLMVDPPAAPDGSYQVQVTVRGLEDGSRWVVDLFEQNTQGGTRVGRVAVEGRWTVAEQFPAPTSGDLDELVFVVSTHERGARRHGCALLNSPTRPVAGLSTCNNLERLIIMLTRELDDGSTLVRTVIVDARPDSRWHLKLSATGTASRQVVDFDDRASRRGAVLSRVVMTGVEDPRLRMVATRETGGRCLIGLDPPNVGTDAPLKPGGLAQEARVLLN